MSYETGEILGLTTAIKKYVAFLNQTGTNAPTATIVENTLGAIPTFSRTDVGEYFMTCPGVFTVGKTVVFCGNSSFDHIVAVPSSVNDIYILSIYGVNNTQMDSRLTNMPIQVLVYP
jgi:hypothetical protein